jgi:23S rRNA pseudouridine1911/1915/1917 synthase
MHEWTATDSGRLDIFLAKNDATISRVKARDVIKDGLVMVNGRIARKPAMIVQPNDVVQMSATKEPVTETRLKALDLKLEVLYEDDACLVINKPAGIPVHPGAGIPADAPTILHGIAFLFKQRKIPFSSAAVLVHRLDKDTTGALLIAKSPAHHKELQKQFESRTVRKMYLAIVDGIPHPAAAVIDASIGRSSVDRTKMTLLGSSKTREAKTTYRTLTTGKNVALLSCELHTGRTHQIRVHLHGIGHPILGDPTYHMPTSEKASTAQDIQSICLHAWKLAFVSPADNKEHQITVEPTGEFLKNLKHLHLSVPST